AIVQRHPVLCGLDRPASSNERLARVGGIGHLLWSPPTTVVFQPGAEAWWCLVLTSALDKLERDRAVGVQNEPGGPRIVADEVWERGVDEQYRVLPDHPPGSQPVPPLAATKWLVCRRSPRNTEPLPGVVPRPRAGQAECGAAEGEF